MREQSIVSTPTWVLGICLVFASTAFRGGNRYLALLLLETLASFVLIGLVLRVIRGWATNNSFGKGWEYYAFFALLTSPIWVPLLQLVHLPSGWFAVLPGRQEYLGATTVTQVYVASQPTSLTPLATWSALAAGLPVSACFALALACNGQQQSLLARLWIAVSVTQAILGLLQLGPFPELHFGLPQGELVGTFASKNTYSNFMVMTIPLVIWQLTRPHSDVLHRERKNQVKWLWGAALFLLVSALFAAMSRTAITTGLLVALLSMTLLPARKARNWAGLPWGIWGMALLIALALAAGGMDWMERFDADHLVADDAVRALTREATWQGTLAFWPLGSGLGSYAWVFPRFQSPEVGSFLLDLAHNDYLQILMETGALGLIAMALALALMGRRAMQLFRAGRGTWSSADRLAVACGLGLLATLLHAWVDYPFRIPANAMLAAFLLGVFLRQPVTSADDPQKVKSRTYV